MISLAEHIDAIAERVRRLDQMLISDLEGAAQDLRGLIDSQRQALGDAGEIPSGAGDIEAYRECRGALGQKLFAVQAAQWERRRPFRRALDAVETYEAGITDVVRSAPESVPISRQARTELLRKHGIRGLKLQVSKVRRGKTALPLRSLLARGVRSRLSEFSEVESRFFLSIAWSLRRLRLSWEIARIELDSNLARRPRPDREIQLLRSELADEVGAEGEQARTVLADVRAWSARNVPGLVAAVVSGIRTEWRGTLDFRNLEREQQDHFVRQLQSGENELRLELALMEFEDDVLKLAASMVRNIDDERSALMQELDETAAWCEAILRASEPGDMPQPRADFVPISSRIRDFEASMWAEMSGLPESVRVLPRLYESPPRRPNWQVLAPRDCFRSAYQRLGHAGFAKALEDVEGEHRRLVREIERAREVVAFGCETASAEHQAQVAEEAIRNAISLLRYARDQARDWHEPVIPRVTAALAAVFGENRLLLRRRKLGVLLYLTQEGFRQAPRIVGDAALQWIRHALRTAGGAFASLANRFLVAIGWRAAPGSEEIEVVTRPFLPAEFTVDLSAKELPAIYRRLFRFAPVEDPRFLIGREDELRAISDARTLWEEGRPVSALIVGRRGSGKTSLINCSLRRGLQGLETIRGEFQERVTSAEDVRRVISTIAGIADPSGLEAFLRERRRVFIVEELERTFLRQVGCYGAVRELQRLISATCSTTLWVLATNEIAFRFLDTTLGLGNSFSHRINASTASRDDLRQAILLRHNLSGLRLQFTPSRPSLRVVDRLKRRFQGEGDPEETFFDLLSRESSGVFRTAFEIWLGQIDHSAAGALYMKPLQDIDLSDVVNDLEIKDLVTLVAVLQHGSLTPAEHARIFQKSLEAGRTQIDELVAREIIEPDPSRTGYRVRPEAMRVVLEALYRSNLL